ALGLADLLDHDLLGALGGDPAEFAGVDHLVALGRLDLAGHAVDGDDDFRLVGLDLFLGAAAVGPLGRQLQRGLDPLEDDLLGDVLFAVHGVHDPQNVRPVHRRFSLAPLRQASGDPQAGTPRL